MHLAVPFYALTVAPLMFRKIATSEQRYLNEFIAKSDSECLNQSEENPLANALTDDDTLLISDCDEQVCMCVLFGCLCTYCCRVCIFISFSEYERYQKMLYD